MARSSKTQNKLSLLFLMMVLVTGCVEPHILDELQLVHAIGYDQVSEDNIEGTVSIPVFRSEEDITSETISAVSRTTKDIRLFLDAQSSKPLHTGKVSTILFDQALSEAGLMRILDTYVRDPRIGMRIHLAMVEGVSTKELLETTYPLEIETAVYITDLIEQNTDQQNLPETNFHTFLSQYYGQGRDPFLPVLKREENVIKLTGLALFDGDKYVESIDLKECFYVKVLTERFGDGFYEIILNPEEDEYTTLRNFDAKTSFKVEDAKTNPKIEATIDLTGKINEYSGPTLDEEKIDEIQSLTTKQLQTEISQFIERMQELNIDPIGLGDQVRRHDPEFSDDKWKQQYSDAEITVNVKITIKETGVEE
ncbi:Ger(x)C family spore germination protein [Alteribacter populi]|uniref:Ger(x)C family spore germination protein n=1 Tax=Alteribacter populi TaxID=2011011 RepID=UPI000BBA9D6F|nr:Ger(x)C family spore germination protein [Alteribacter populi]